MSLRDGRPAVRDRPAVVGRAREIEAVRALMRDAREGRGAAMLVRGEPGAGKSTILREGRAEAERLGMRVLAARGVASESRLAFAGLWDVLRPVLDRVDEIPDGQRTALRAALKLEPPTVPDRFAAYAAALSLIGAVASEGPLLVLIDDAHWLDSSSMEALAFCARRVQDEPVAMLAASRTPPHEEVDVPDAAELLLDPLGDDDAGALLAEVTRGAPLDPGVAAELLRLAKGSPLALVELPAALSAQERGGRVPFPRPFRVGEAILGAYRRHLEALDAPARRALLVAALSDDGALGPIDGALRRLGGEGVDLAAVEDAGLVVLDGDRALLRHPLLRAVALELAGPAERRAGHRALAEAMGGERVVEQRAWHLAEAAVGPDDEAADALDEAASGAAEQTAYASAAGLLERAAGLSGDPDRAVRRRLAAGRHWLLAGRGGDALRVARRARDDARDPATLGAISHLEARGLMWEGPVDAAYRTLLAAARSSLGREPVTAAQLLLDAAVTRAVSGDCQPIVELSRRALEAATRGDDPPTIAAARAMLGVGLTLRGRRRAAAPLLATITHLEEHGDPRTPTHHSTLLAAHLWAITDASVRPEDVIDPLLDATRRAGAIGLLPFALSVRADIDFRAGRWALALSRCDEAVALVTETGTRPFRAHALAVRSMILAALGRAEDARMEAQRTIDVSTARGSDNMTNFARWVLGFEALAGGRTDEAVAHLEAVAATIRRHGIGEPAFIPWAPDLVEGYLRLGRREDARAVLAELARQAFESGGRLGRAVACRCRGLLDDDIDRHFGEALAHHDRDDMPFERARTELLYGGRLRRARRRAEARARLESALRTFERLGAAPWARQAREELAASGARPRPARAAGPADRLSSRELQVAMTVAEGLTNRETAARLFLSERTVERHLGSVYRKLGLRSRAQLARLLSAP